MKGMPTIPGKDLEIMDSAEVAIAKRRQRLNGLLQHGDPFTGRLICQFGEIACIIKEINETSRIPQYGLKKGIHDCKIFAYGPSPMGKDFSSVKPILDKVRAGLEKYRIGYDMWEFCYSFKDYDELVELIVKLGLKQPDQLPNESNQLTMEAQNALKV